MKIAGCGAFVITGLLLTGCGGSASLSPTGPSAATGAAAGTTISGTVNGASSGASASGGAGMGAMALGSSITVKVAGSGVSSVVDQSGQFTLPNVPAGDVVLQFSGPGVDAHVTIAGVGAGDRIRINVLVGGGSAVVTHEDRVKADNRTELEGRISGIEASARTLTVDGRAVTVPATAVIRKGDRAVTFGELAVGQRVHVKAASEGTGLVASEVIVQNDGGRDDDDEVERELKGAVSGLSGTCPTISFTVAGTSVSANGATDYRNGACADVKAGSAVEVKTMRTSAGAVVATRIAFERK